MTKKLGVVLMVALVTGLQVLGGEQTATADDLFATQYDGVDDYAVATNVTGGNLGDTAGTFYLWVKRDGTAGLVNDLAYNGLYNLLILKTGTGANIPKVGVGLTSNGRVRIYRYPPHSSMPGTTVITDNQWHFLALTSDGTGTLKLYVDGNLEVTWSPGMWSMAGLQVLALSAYYDSSAYLSFTQTLIDQVAIWSVERTQAQIQADMCTGLNGNESGLAAYWPMDEGSEITAADATGNGQTLTLVNGAQWFQDTEGPSICSGCEADLAQCEADLTECLANPIMPDQDGDGEADLTDACSDTLDGEEVDQAGCSLAQFCSAIDATTAQGVKTCNKSDWRNDEPLMRAKEADCKVARGGRGRADDRCVPR